MPLPEKALNEYPEFDLILQGIGGSARHWHQHCKSTVKHLSALVLRIIALPEYTSNWTIRTYPVYFKTTRKCIKNNTNSLSWTEIKSSRQQNYISRENFLILLNRGAHLCNCISGFLLLRIFFLDQCKVDSIFCVHVGGFFWEGAPQTRLFCLYNSPVLSKQI